jgi:hypothetical protein
MLMATRPARRRYSVIVTDRSGPCQVGTWLNPASFTAFEAVCRREDVTKAELLRRLIEQYITGYGSEGK